MALKADSPEAFLQILERLWWRLDKVLTLDDTYSSAMVGMVDCIRNGVTTIFDHHASPNAVTGSLFRIADAAQQTGVRSCLCYEVSDRDGESIADQGLRENRAFLQFCRQSGNGLLSGLFGLHASFTLSDRTLARAAEMASGLNAGFHIHTAEAASDVAHCQREHGKRVVHRLHDLGLLGSRTIAAHCVHVDDTEIGILRDTGTSVVHNPESNMGNAVGCAPILHMMQSGVRVGLGSDGYTCDMFESLKVANLLHKHQAGSPSVGWAEPHTMLFNENSRIASKCFGRTVGKLVPGAHADLIIVDYDPPTPLLPSNLSSHILFGISGRMVDTTIVGGRILMQDRKLIDIDEQAVTAEARLRAANLWQRF
jgi:putative selenium metabolism protein SsnA